MNIYINENDDIQKNLIQKIPSLLNNENKIIYNILIKQIKRNNNNIGFFDFNIINNANENICCKIFIFPKNIKIKNEPTEQQKISYMLWVKTFFNLHQKYIKNTTFYKSSYLLKKEDDLNEFSDLFYFLLKNEILQEINKLIIFIKKNQKKIVIEKKVIKGINIKKNVIQMNKAKIEKNVKVIENLEILSDIYNTILKIKLGAPNELLFKLNFIKIFIERIFLNKKIILKKSQRKKRIYKYTGKNNHIYKTINYLSNSNGTIFTNKKNDDTLFFNSFFIDPKLLFEYYVYEKLKMKYDKVILIRENRNKKNSFLIKTIKNSAINIHERKSEPDLICEDQKNIYIFDIKWKILKNNELPSESDILKIIRDKEIYIYNNKKLDKKINIGLIYPKIDNEIDYIYEQEYNNNIVHIMFIDI